MLLFFVLSNISEFFFDKNFGEIEKNSFFKCKLDLFFYFLEKKGNFL
jgi:hypothetical protein